MKRKKSVAIVLSMALGFSALSPLGEVPKSHVNAMTDSFQVIRDTVGKVSEYGYLPIHKTIVNQEDLNVGKKKQSLRYTETIPKSYDARQNGLLTNIKDQGTIENCWAYAVMGASEANIKKKGYEANPDFSEAHISYSLYNKTNDPLGLTEGDICRVKRLSNDLYSWGGNDYYAVSTLSRWQGITNESDAPMQNVFSAIQNRVVATLPEEVLNKDSYHIENAEYVYLSEENRDLIKKKIMQYGAGTLSYYASMLNSELQKYSNTKNANYTAYYCKDRNKESDHEVMVVGWDDDYAVENFNENCRPAHPGAWLIRNSWGNNNEMNGYFWLSYEDAVIDVKNNSDAEVGFFDIEKVDRYMNNYQYDGGLPISYIETCKAANVFTAKTQENIRAVSFYTQERNIKYEINFYKTKNVNQPASGEKLGNTLTGTCEERGYHTIRVNENDVSAMRVNAGDTFSVVLTLKNAQGDYSHYTYETKVGNSLLEEQITGGANQSFMYNGNEWVDFAKQKDITGKTFDANMCIKVFTIDAALAPTATPTPTPTPTATATATATATPTATATATVKPTTSPTASASVSPSMGPAPTPTMTSYVTPTPKPVIVPSVKPRPTATPTSTPNSQENGEQAGQSQNGGLLWQETTIVLPIVKKLSVSTKTKKVKVNKKLYISKYVKIEKNRKGTPVLSYKFTKASYKKYASLSEKGVLKAKKKGHKKTLYVEIRDLSGSGKSTKIKIKII